MEVFFLFDNASTMDFNIKFSWKILKFDSYAIAKDIINGARLVERLNILPKKRVGKKNYRRLGEMIKL